MGADLGSAGRRVSAGAPPQAAFPRHPRPPRPAPAEQTQPSLPLRGDRASSSARVPRRPHAWVRPDGQGSRAGRGRRGPSPECVSKGSPSLRGARERKQTTPSSQLPDTMFNADRSDRFWSESSQVPDLATGSKSSGERFSRRVKCAHRREGVRPGQGSPRAANALPTQLTTCGYSNRNEPSRHIRHFYFSRSVEKRCSCRMGKQMGGSPSSV